MTLDFLYHYIGKHKLAVISTVDKDGNPQSAVIGIAVNRKLEIVFDTLNTSRKYANILRHAKVSLVIGWNDESTVQYEGVAAALGDEGNEYRELYYSVFPDGRQRAENRAGLAHFKVSPVWIRYSDFNEPQQLEEMKF
jgi:pyridoxine/pyridoxamine 5'-phosphate oxidase